MRLFLQAKFLVPSILCLFVAFVWGIYSGFPWEHIIAANKAKKYVRETYNLTPERVGTSIFLDYVMIAKIKVKEFEYPFDIRISRRGTKITDNYWEQKTSHVLSEELNNYVKQATNNRGFAFVDIFNNQFEAFTVKQLTNNPNLAFERIPQTYNCCIAMEDDISKNNYQIDYNMMYDIYNHIVQSALKPDGISFLFECQEFKEKLDGRLENLHIKINRHEILNINSVDELKAHFEKVIKKEIDG